jgi:cell division protein FtsB
MSSSCPNTILLVTRDRLLRADLRAGRKVGVTEIYEEHSLAADDLPSQVEATLRLSKRRPGRVWILAGDIWTQTLSLPPEAVTGLKPDEITRALGFEAEPYSSLGAMEAAMAAVPLSNEGRASEGRQRHFWLTEMPAAQLEQIDFLVRQAGGRLMGISHPGGLLAPLNEAAEVPWRRVELWPGAIIAIQRPATGAARVTVVNTEPRPGRWLNDVTGLEAGGPANATTHWLHATRSLPIEEIPRQGRYSLEDSDTQRQFLAAWAEQIASGGAISRIVSPKRPMSNGVRQSISAAIGLVAIIACIVAQTFVNSHNNRLAAVTQKLKESAAQLASLKGENDKLEKKRDEVKKSCDKLKDDLEHYSQVMRAQRQRLVTMLKVLTRGGPDDLLIRKIEGTENHIILHGLCLEAQFADNLASALATALADTFGPEGWQVQPPTRQSKDMLVGGGPWEFEVRIQDPEIKASLPAKGAIGPVKRPAEPARSPAEPTRGIAGPPKIAGGI